MNFIAMADNDCETCGEMHPADFDGACQDNANAYWPAIHGDDPDGDVTIDQHGRLWVSCASVFRKGGE